jgi:bacillolysin
MILLHVIASLVSISLIPSASAADRSQPFSFSGPFSQAFRAAKALEKLKENPQIQAALQNDAVELSFHQHIQGAGLETFKFQQTYRGLEVVGAQALHHSSEDGRQVDITNQMSRFDLEVRPTISAEEAVSIAQGSAGDLPLYEAPTLKILSSRPRGSVHPRLTYWIELDAFGDKPGRQVILDAHTGQILVNRSALQTIAPIHVYSTTGRSISIDPSTIQSPANIRPEWKRACQLVNQVDGSPLSLNLSACDQVVTAGTASSRVDDAAREAAENARAVLNYFQNQHAYNSFDNAGAALKSLVHVGSSFDNAFWDPREEYMGYGDGDGVRTGRYTLGKDVAGHEMTHGLIRHTAAFLPMDESGALDEAYADFFGLIVAKNTTWELGKSLALDPVQAKALRNLANPNSMIAFRFKDDDGRIVSVPYPAHVRQQLPSSGMDCNDENDMCWVHINSTIPGHASYKIFKSLGQKKAETLYFTVLTQYLTPGSGFQDAADLTRKACTRLLSGPDCALVDQAFTAVGL